MYAAGQLEQDLRALGVRAGDTLLVQSSLRSVGPVDGGGETILKALLGVLGPEGTLVVYTASPENSDTSRLALALTEHLGPAELRAHRATMPPYDPATTPTSPILGAFSELVRAQPGALRSAHPQTSFTALGPKAAELTARHDLDCHLGERSPVGALYRTGARALLVGIPVWCCTAFHLAEYRLPGQGTQRYGCVVTDSRGLRQWVHFDAPKLEDEHFVRMGEALAQDIAGLIRGRLGEADCFLLAIPEGVDACTAWLGRER
ncbi:Putative aminoglycoside 3-N-acetyltransferase [Kitasatospora sp. MMS16-BH015]|uniref:aminoglycoside N(3)-acetyltransferase n=1 Tax=Kitasatospora sp. MMS16-BH015 TaxID=2018025 RepID=UPI000CA19E38|nr:AAC(3) family N-acetyltransferase [Kitasatospora sp. MMS16-BH015]AUG79176.1 Putative aminoglycoside 3-N-acetyltransferase [Kitasatospora sp. MMS16-BH015]